MFWHSPILQKGVVPVRNNGQDSRLLTKMIGHFAEMNVLFAVIKQFSMLNLLVRGFYLYVLWERQIWNRDILAYLTSPAF